ncbi:hypothetical protein PHMEG_00024412 [Phytophthora megakarya]|uniref:Uncharacterized protein n=1 Tax=Phytophthora megakarya TaxID=4795 RepID=A0A225VEK0_9STRA|nr:hypothetical protein PHMEG_00024412 [Phytophthora megakarya]
MNAVIKSHQEMYDHLANRMQLALHSNEILTKEVNHGRSEYLVGIHAFKKSNENLHKLPSLTDPNETTLTLKLRFELDKIDWETLAPDSQTRRALQAVHKIGLSDGRDRDSLADDIARAKVRFVEMRAKKQHKAEEEAAAAAGLFAPPPLMVSVHQSSTPVAQDSSASTTSSPTSSVLPFLVAASAPSPSRSRSLSIT